MSLPMRSLAMILGVVGAVVGFIVSMLYSIAHVLGRIAGITANSSHFFIGVGLTILALIGAALAPFSGIVAGLLMVLSVIGFAFIIGWWAILPAIFLLPAAWMAVSNRALQGEAEPRQPAAH
jgi:hypothetical protein